MCKYFFYYLTDTGTLSGDREAVVRSILQGGAADAAYNCLEIGDGACVVMSMNLAT